MNLRVVEGTEPPAVTIEFVAPAAHGASSAHGYFEVWHAGFPCGHKHFKRSGAIGCKERLERWLRRPGPPALA